MLQPQCFPSVAFGVSHASLAHWITFCRIRLQPLSQSSSVVSKRWGNERDFRNVNIISFVSFIIIFLCWAAHLSWRNLKEKKEKIKILFQFRGKKDFVKNSVRREIKVVEKHSPAKKVDDLMLNCLVIVFFFLRIKKRKERICWSEKKIKLAKEKQWLIKLK